MPLGVHLGYPGFHLERPHRVRDAPADYPDRTRAINDDLNDDLTADFRRWYRGFTHTSEATLDDQLQPRSSHGLSRSRRAPGKVLVPDSDRVFVTHTPTQNDGVVARSQDTDETARGRVPIRSRRSGPPR